MQEGLAPEHGGEVLGHALEHLLAVGQKKCTHNGLPWYWKLGRFNLRSISWWFNFDPLLDGRGVAREGHRHLQALGRDVADRGLDVVRDPFHKVPLKLKTERALETGAPKSEERTHRLVQTVPIVQTIPSFFFLGGKGGGRGGRGGIFLLCITRLSAVPSDELRRVLVLHVQHLLIHFLSRHPPAEQGRRRQVAAMARIRRAHHVLGIKPRGGMSLDAE